LKILCFLLFALTFESCSTSPDSPINAFKKVNDSLEKANRQISADNAYVRYYSEILLKAEINIKWAGKAIDLHDQVELTMVLIEQTRGTLRKMDSLGEDTKTARKLLVNTGFGDTLRTSIEETAHLCEICLVGKGQLPRVQANLQLTRQLIVPEHWSRQLFNGQSTVAALTTLGYFKSQLLKSATLTLKDIDDHLK